MKKILFYFCVALLYASENKVLENYPQKLLRLNEEQKKILEESKIQQRAKENRIKRDVETIKGSTKQRDGNLVKDHKLRKSKEGEWNENNSVNKIEINNNKNKREFEKNKDYYNTVERKKDKDLFNSYINPQRVEEPDQEKHLTPNFNQWIYGTAVITTTFLNGAIKRSYGVLLRDGMFVTSANMVYDKNVYARESYAMMQDDSSIPFICVAKLSVKALDLQKGLAILETLSYTDIYCNERNKSYYHDRIYSRHWVDIFATSRDELNPIVYSPYITELNSFATQKYVLRESLERLATKESNDFEGYKYAYGKGFYAYDGKLLGIVGASQDGLPKFIKTKEISNFLCELKERKILKNPYLQTLCPSSKKKD